ncbi:lactoylglutathione lyase [Desulfuribacillus alkaliarsenatis]|uniref:Aldoketomutase n=1 Tax=Desulfuribacillus alkaliarsenatis TaxID=766136 RepID=A0A1E5G2X9_9FIRM|nr:VOC family protein [Desulfuribacillus alkaliarsenatis]OEF97427.1 lactoylglutathione lyase [Desulfuribacillus alkaliarsenatis]
MSYKMLHTCIRVKDLEKSLAFYQGALGLVETRRIDYPEYKFTLVYLSDESKAYELELTYNYNQEESYEIGNGFSHTAVETNDLEASHKKHQDMGYQATKLMGLPGTEPSYYFVTDPDGYRVEVIRASKKN